MPQDRPLAPPLGLGALIAQSFRLLGTHFGMLFPLAFVPALVLALLSWLVSPAPQPVDPATATGVTVSGAALAVGLLGIVVSFFVTGVMCLAALDAVLDKHHTLGEYTAQTLRHIVPIIALGVVLSIAIGLGIALLVVPGLYVAARYFPWVPAVVFENAGWSGLTRARDLTEGYRWPLAGALLALTAIIIGVSLLISPLAAATAGNLLGVLIGAVMTGLYYALIAIFTALVYARLREIKDGLGIGQIAALID